MIGERLKEVRQKRQITVEKLSQIVNIPIRTIGGYERNERKPSFEFLKNLHSHLQVNLNYIIAGTGDPFLECEKNLDGNIQQHIKKEIAAAFKAKGL